MSKVEFTQVPVPEDGTHIYPNSVPLSKAEPLELSAQLVDHNHIVETAIATDGTLFVRVWHLVTGKELCLKTDLAALIRDGIRDQVLAFEEEEVRSLSKDKTA